MQKDLQAKQKELQSLKTAKDQAETRFGKANNEKKKAQEDARLKRVREAKNNDLKDATADATSFNNIKAMLQTKVTELTAKVAAAVGAAKTALTAQLVTQAVLLKAAQSMMAKVSSYGAKL